MELTLTDEPRELSESSAIVTEHIENEVESMLS